MTLKLQVKIKRPQFTLEAASNRWWQDKTNASCGFLRSTELLV